MNILEAPIGIRTKLKSPYDLGLLAAEAMQQFSHDPKKQTGAAIIDKSYNIYGLGSNTYPHGKTLLFKDQELLKSNGFDNEHRFRLEHAERNAISFAVRNGNPLTNTTMTVSYTPCVDCANSICNMGITELIDASVPDFTHHRWGAGWEYVVKDLFPRCGVKYENYQVDPKVRDSALFAVEKLVANYYGHNR